MLYILAEDDTPVPCDDLLRWEEWMRKDDRRTVAKTTIEGLGQISTVFLGIDHDWSFHGPPVLWETMIFGGPHDGYQDRYTSKAEALAGHKSACDALFNIRARGEP